MNINSEISRLLDVMPASGRMLTKIVSKSTQSEVIRIPFAFPWNRSKRLIYINFDLWYQLTEAQRDLLILRVGFQLQDVYSFKLNLNQFILSLGVLELFIKVLQRDTLGISIFGILIIIFTNLNTEYANNTPILLAYKSLSSKARFGIKWCESLRFK